MYKSGEFLKSIRKTDFLIKRKNEQLERLEHLAVYSNPQPDPNGGGHGTKVVMDSKAEIVCSIVDLKTEINKQIDKLIDIKLKAMKMIDSLENGDIVDILYMRYFEYRKWDDIAEAKSRSLDWIFRLHREGLKKLEINFYKNVN